MDHFKAFIKFIIILLPYDVLAFGHKACGILAPHSGIKPSPSTGRRSLNHRTAREVPTQCHFMLLLLCSFKQPPTTWSRWTMDPGKLMIFKSKRKKKVVVEESFISMDVSRNLQLEDVGALNAWPGIVSAALCGWFLVPHRHWCFGGLWKSLQLIPGWGHPGPLVLLPPKHPQTSALLPGPAFLLRLSRPFVERHPPLFLSLWANPEAQSFPHSELQLLNLLAWWCTLRGFLSSCSYFIHSPDKLPHSNSCLRFAFWDIQIFGDLWSQRSEPSLIFSDFLYASLQPLNLVSSKGSTGLGTSLHSDNSSWLTLLTSCYHLEP